MIPSPGPLFSGSISNVGVGLKTQIVNQFFLTSRLTAGRFSDSASAGPMVLHLWNI